MSGAVGRGTGYRQTREPVPEHSVQKRISTLGLIGLSPASRRHKEQTDSADDAKIIDLVLNGNVDAFEHLLNRYRDRVFGIVSRHVPGDDIEEVAQDVFIRAFKSLPGYRRESNFQNWISSITVKTCHDFWRRRYRSREVAISGLSLPHQKWLEQVIAQESRDSFVDEVDRKEAGEILRWALSQLPEKDKTVLELLYFQEYSIKETAELLAWSQSSVKVRSFRARQKLQKILRGAMKPNSEEI